MTPSELSEDAQDILLNANACQGGLPGIWITGSSAPEELQQAKLLTPKLRLTKAGARVAARLQIDYWGQVQ